MLIEESALVTTLILLQWFLQHFLHAATQSRSFISCFHLAHIILIVSATIRGLLRSMTLVQHGHCLEAPFVLQCLHLELFLRLQLLVRRYLDPLVKYLIIAEGNVFITHRL